MTFKLLVISILCVFFNGCASICPCNLSKNSAAIVWELEGFDYPESVVYDPTRELLYISSIKGSPMKKDGDGYISQVSLDGKMVKHNWITGLNGPKGISLHDDTLWVADVGEIVEIDVISGKILNRYAAKDSKFLNDTVVDSKGNVYISDTPGNTIYRISKGKIEKWLCDEMLECPNGLYIKGDTMIVASWGVITGERFATEISGHLKRVSLNNKTIESLGNGSPIGNLDGLDHAGRGCYLTTDSKGGFLKLISPDGSANPIAELESGCADFDYIVDKKLVVVAMLRNNMVSAYRLEAK